MYRIYFEYWKGIEFCGRGVSTAGYATVKAAEIAARQDFYDRAGIHFECVIASENPFADNQAHTNNN